MTLNKCHCLGGGAGAGEGATGPVARAAGGKRALAAHGKGGLLAGMSSRVLQFHYTLRDADGRVLDTSRGDAPLSCVEGAEQIVPGLEKVLRAMQPGDQRKVAVAPEEGYGVPDETLIGRVPRAQLPVADEIKVGDQFRTGPDPYAPIVRVIALEGEEVVLDANHPLAGQTLFFEVELTAARAATAEEVAQARAALGG